MNNECQNYLFGKYLLVSLLAHKNKNNRNSNNSKWRKKINGIGEVLASIKVFRQCKKTLCEHIQGKDAVKGYCAQTIFFFNKSQ